MSHIFTLEQAAQYLQLTPEELLLELEQGHLPGRKIAGKWRISQDALERFLDQVDATERVSAGSEDQLHIEPQTEVTVSEDEVPSVASEAAITFSPIQVIFPDLDITDQTSAITSAAQEVPQQTTSNNTPFEQGVLHRTVARVVRYNVFEKFGYARLSNSEMIMIEFEHFVDKHYSPLPNDIIELEIVLSKKGKKQARNISIVERDSRIISLPKSSATTTHEPSEQFYSSPHSSMTKSPVTQIRRTTSSHPPGGTLESRRYYEKAALAQTEGRIDDARRHYRDAIKAGAGIAVYAAFAKMESEKGSTTEAFKLLREAIELFPNHAGFYDMYGNMERRSKNYQRAIEIFRAGLSKVPQDTNLLRGLFQALVQMNTPESLDEAAGIFKQLEKNDKLHRNDRTFQRFNALQENRRANAAYEFFQSIPGTRSRIAGRRALPDYITDLIIEINNPSLQELFGLAGHVLVRCFRGLAKKEYILGLHTYLNGLKPSELLGTFEGPEVLISRSIVFVAVQKTDEVREQVLKIIGESNIAIIPVDDDILRHTDRAADIMGELLVEYLGARDLYYSTQPVAVSERRFFGREQMLVQLADDVTRGQFVGIYGLRKMGKTSLVYQLRDERLKSEAVAYVDLQSSQIQSTKTCAALYYELQNDLYQRLYKRVSEIGKYLRLGQFDGFSDLSQAQRNDAALIFVEDMQKLLDAIRKQELEGVNRVVVVLDELERLLPVSGQTPIEGYLEFFGMLRGLMQNERNRGLLSCIVVAANASISERGYWDDRENPVFALYKPTFLPPFSLRESDEMIRTLGKAMGVQWADEAIRAIYAETTGHPFLTRLFCSRVIRHKPRPLHVSATMVEEQIKEFLRDEGDKLEQIIELLNRHFPNESDLLEQIALDESLATVSEESIRHLFSYHLVEEQNGHYQITLNLLRRWLQRRAGVRDANTESV